jgi:PAS domain S-box-containing protein
MFNELKEQAKKIQSMGDEIMRVQQSQIATDNLLRQVIDQIPAMIFWKDNENNITDINAYGIKLFGAPKEKILGSKWQDLEPDKKKLQQYFDNDYEVISTGQAKMNIIESLAGDEDRKFLTHKIPLSLGGKIIGIIGFSTEITEPLRDCENGG